MTEDVLLKLKGIQRNIDEDDATELITEAKYYYKNGKHFVIYEELDMETGAITKTTLKIDKDALNVIKRGASNVHMVHEKGKQHLTCYQTNAGNLMMDTYTSQFSVEETDERITVQIEYSLSLNDVFISDCLMDIQVIAKGSIYHL